MLTVKSLIVIPCVQLSFAFATVVAPTSTRMTPSSSIVSS